MITITEENYLIEIWRIYNTCGTVSINNISQRLSVKKPSANSMVKRLSDLGYIEYLPYKPIVLTDEGRKVALLVLRKHRLTEMFLCQIMNIDQEHVHHIAEQIEHIKSPVFFDKIDSMLNYPKLDPHGEPIPDINGVIPKHNFIKLSLCAIGEPLVIRSISNKSKQLMTLLSKKGITLNNQVHIVSIEEYDGSISVEYNGNTIFLSRDVAEKIMVEKIELPQ